MSAPSSSRLSIARLLLLVAACALVAAGCTVPGSSRLQSPPANLPPSLDLVTADVLGYTIYDTNPQSKLWDGLGSGAADDMLGALHSGLTGGFDPELDDVDPWIGGAAGTALRELDLNGKTETSTMYFADVRDRGKLEAFLDAAGWSIERSSDFGGRGENVALWTHRAACDDTPSGTRAICAASQRVAYRAAAVTDDAIVAARTTTALKSLLRSADEYAVPERRAMSEFTVEAAARVPVAFVFRADLLRTQVRRPFENDPALLEFARWATDSNVLVALRDGWVGLAPAIDAERRDEAVRVVGAAEWVPDLAPDISLDPVGSDLIGKLGPGFDVAVSIRDPGQQIKELIRAITFGAGQYVTEQDVPEGGEREELQPLLDRLDGEAAIGYRQGLLRMVIEGDGRLSSDVVSALDHADIGAVSGVVGGDVASVDIPIPVMSTTAKVGAAGDRRRTPANGISPDFSDAGAPPLAPFAWIRTSGRGCIGATAGWLTFDGTERMTLGMDIELHGVRNADEDPRSLLGTCADSVVTRSD